MRRWFLPTALGITVMYWGLAVLGLYMYMGPWLNALRMILAIAILCLYAPTLKNLFRNEPYKDTDYHIAGTMLTWTSIAGFAVWNEAGRIFDIPTTVTVSAIAGYFMMIAGVGGYFVLRAPRIHGTRIAFAISFGAIIAFLVVMARILSWYQYNE